MLLHGKFETVDRLGSKWREYKMSPFCYIIGNAPTKIRSELNDKSLLILSLSFVQNYLLRNTARLNQIKDMGY